MTEAVEIAERSSGLFSLPDVYIQLQRLIENEDSTVDQMAELIALDAALAARLLKIANSSFYNFPAQIDTVSRAITLIGSAELSNLVLATSVVSSFDGVPHEVIDMDSFWRHNVDTGLVARHLGGKAGLPDVERFFVAGLLHNIGKLVVLTELPEKAHHALMVYPDVMPWQQEQEALGFTFADCGAELMKIWNLPESLIESVRYQHDPALAQADSAAVSILHIANRAASHMEEETKGEEGVDYIRLINACAWAETGLAVTDLEEAIEYAQAEAWGLLGLITGSLH